MLTFRRSSFCSLGDCVEVAFHRSSFCSNGSCVEVAHAPDAVLVRDSKNPERYLTFTVQESGRRSWQA